MLFLRVNRDILGHLALVIDFVERHDTIFKNIVSGMLPCWCPSWRAVAYAPVVTEMHHEHRGLMLSLFTTGPTSNAVHHLLTKK